MDEINWETSQANLDDIERRREARRYEAEYNYHLLSEPSDGVFPQVPYNRKKKVPGGNPTLPVSSVLLSPNGEDFWHENMPSYILEILDETRTNGYVVDGDQIRLLADDTGDGRLRAKYARLALLRAGAIELE